MPSPYFLLILLSITGIAKASGTEVAFGTLRDDGVISTIMYYRNGAWIKPRLSQDQHEIYGKFGGTRDLKDYAKLVWGTQTSIFKQWHKIGRMGESPVHFRHAFVGGGMGDCEADAAIIQSDGSAKNNKLDWVSTHARGYTWHSFYEVARTTAEDNSSQAIRISNELQPLVAAIKERWSLLESEIVSKRLPATHHREITQKLQNRQYNEFWITRADGLAEGSQIIHFGAEKFINDPFFHYDNNSDGSLFVAYRGLLMLYPDGKFASLAAFVDFEPFGKYVEDSITLIDPVAVISLDNRAFIVAETDTYSGRGKNYVDTHRSLSRNREKLHGHPPERFGGCPRRVHAEQLHGHAQHLHGHPP